MAGEIEFPIRAAVYTFSDGHIERAIGSYRLVSSFGRFFPYYAFDQQGRLRRLGNFEEGRPWRSAFYRLLNKSQVMRYYRPGIAPRLRDEHSALSAAIIGESDRLLRERFGGRLYVLLYPGSRFAPQLVRRLEQLGVAYLDYSSLFDPAAPGYSIEGDGHPTPQAYRVVARQLARDLRAELAPR